MDYHHLKFCTKSNFICEVCDQQFKFNSMSEDEQNDTINHSCIDFMKEIIGDLRRKYVIGKTIQDG